MKIYSATLETGDYIFEDMPNDYIDYGFVSFFYLKDDNQFEMILSKCKNILIDSGAYSYQQGQNKNLRDYVKKYGQFIKKYHSNPKVVGFFEMDIDLIIGYETVLAIRKKFEKITNKIIPVWHHNRGIDEYIKMCQEYSGRRISFSGFNDKDVEVEQYNLFINMAHSKGCNLHILGMTRLEMLRNLNLHENDSVDSSSWKQTGIFGGINFLDGNNDIYRFDGLEGLKINYKAIITLNLLTVLHTQKVYSKIDNSIYFNK